VYASGKAGGVRAFLIEIRRNPYDTSILSVDTIWVLLERSWCSLCRPASPWWKPDLHEPKTQQYHHEEPDGFLPSAPSLLVIVSG
jgi:hypothetical protein